MIGDFVSRFAVQGSARARLPSRWFGSRVRSFGSRVGGSVYIRKTDVKVDALYKYLVASFKARKRAPEF